MVADRTTTLFTKLRFVGKTVLASIAAAVAYGLVHDQITIRICPEYFTVWHPHLIDTDSLTVLAIFWGVVATWWMGAVLGLVIGFAAVLGPRPVPRFRPILRALAYILSITGACAIIVGLVAAMTNVTLPHTIMGPEITAMGPAKWRAFTIDLLVHNTSYDIAPIVTVTAAYRIFKFRSLLGPPSGPLPVD